MILIFTGLLAAVLGSFANVLIYRLPRQESWVFSRSQCPNCKSQLRAFELIPILSYLIQKGKCRHCEQSISARYMVVEILFVLGGLFLVSNHGFSVQTLFQSAIWATMIILAFADSETFVLPLSLTILLMVLGLLEGIWMGVWPDRIIACVALGAGLEIFRLIANWVYKTEAFGGGDVFLAAGIGSILGLNLGFLGIYFGFVIGGVFGLVWVAIKKRSFKSRIAFGPALIAGAFCAQIWGGSFLSWILGH